MATKLKQIKDIPVNIEEKILEREKLGMTEISEKVAIPHSIDVIDNVNVLGIVISKKAVKWYENNVNIILFICLDNEKYNNDILYKALLDIVCDKKCIKNILEEPNYKNFIRNIKEKSYEL